MFFDQMIGSALSLWLPALPGCLQQEGGGSHGITSRPWCTCCIKDVRPRPIHRYASDGWGEPRHHVHHVEHHHDGITLKHWMPGMVNGAIPTFSLIAEGAHLRGNFTAKYALLSHHFLFLYRVSSLLLRGMFCFLCFLCFETRNLVLISPSIITQHKKPLAFKRHFLDLFWIYLHLSIL